ncbi:winged helix-turn-helix domain-containing protein [Paenarthrobacter sp. Z7-10]|uniref:winged helix-turn-helix domain-containing protein n=1 Tax=Paenarthrobacter sp. Z7-10 TaxID=2787635 RepID=UPI0022A9CA94|nr:winged helix family transcriptional regulator [Paenarthrobacter sp. Z7-10]MCZ2402815.1 winged helix-turn-helix domain-containing protein [Paenarthrobacter sp. Z7-10]
MSVASGYVHISVRNASKAASSTAGHPQNGWRQPFPGRPSPVSSGVRQGPVQGYRQGPESNQSGYEQLRPVPEAPSAPLTAPTPVVSGGEGLRGVGADNVAHGFVLYVGVDEDAAAAAGTSLVKLAQDIRAYAQSLVPPAQSYAAVAIAPSDAPGTALDVVRSTFGDPTVAARQRQEAARLQAVTEPRPTGVLIDLARREVHLDGDTLNLTFKEFELLNYLVENGARTVGRDELLGGLWRNAEEVPNERTIDVHIRRLRSKLGRLANTVRTVRGEGYRFYEHPEVIVWAAPEYSI